MTEADFGIKNIGMVSTHGYFDPVPQLGQTDTGGQVVYVLELAKALSTFGISVDIYTRWFDRSASQINPLTKYPEVRVIRIPAGPWEFIPKEKIYDVLPELANNMTEFIRQNDLSYDLFHGHYVDGGIVVLDAAGEFDKPSFFTAHSLGAWKKEQMQGDPAEMEKKYKFRHRIAEELRIFNSVTAQSVTTQLQKEKLDELYNFSADNVEVISPGVDVHTFNLAEPETEKEIGEPQNRYIFCLSRIDANKGHDLLLHAFDIVQKRVPDVSLVIGGGSPNPQERELKIFSVMKNIIKQKKMEDRVQVIGYVPDDKLVSLYQQASLFVLPSIFEPFGMTALEAMACGTPVVASKFGGIRNVIMTGKNGLLVNPSDAGEFAEAMIKLIENKTLAEELGIEGYQTIRKFFSWEAIARRHLEFYNKFMS
jgi:mannosylfructose-phosphate synthase